MNDTTLTPEELASRWEAMQALERDRLMALGQTAAAELFAVLRRYPDDDWTLILEFLELRLSLHHRAHSNLLYPEDPQSSTAVQGVQLAAAESLRAS